MEVIILLIVIVVISYVVKNSKKENKIKESSETIKIEDDSDKFEWVHNEIESFLIWLDTPKEDYIDIYLAEEKKDSELIEAIEKHKKVLKKDHRWKEIKRYLYIHSKYYHFIKVQNDKFVKNELEATKSFLGDIDGKSLDQQQRKVVVTSELANLAVASAGSGKTLTVIGKVKYLIERKGFDPKSILVISFTKKAVGEVSERLSKVLNEIPDVSTFHSLGLGIIKEATNIKPNVIDQDISKVVRSIFVNEFCKDSSNLTKMIELMALYYIIPVDKNKFEDENKYFEEVKGNDFQTLKSKVDEISNQKKENKITLKGEVVKSVEELIIANYFYIHGINYEYESSYKHKTESIDFRQYNPDFYLPEYDLYLEHFGVDRNGIPQWLKGDERQRYIDGMQWKREIHLQYNTNLIETYSYYSSDGSLIKNLEKKLKEKNVEINPVDVEKLKKILYDESLKKQLNSFLRLLSTFIQLHKSNGSGLEEFAQYRNDLRKISNRHFENKRETLLLDVFEDIYTRYQLLLENQGKIDFADMINKAIKHVSNNDISLNYKYIIVDEYQDISMNRYKLVSEMIKQTKGNILCVGDDWQSIYRFAGSEVSLFTKFEEYFSKIEYLKIEKTYRNSQELCNIAGDFIQMNRKQLRKSITSSKRQDNPIEVLEHAYDNQVEAVKESIERLNTNQNGSILILARNNYSRDYLVKTGDFIRVKDDDSRLIYRGMKDLDLRFLTVHKSKGLEADNVIVMGVNNELTGFPNKMAEDPILRHVMNDPIEFEYEEERRLFYVAITRTRNKVILLTTQGKNSKFIEELVERHKVTKNTFFEGSDQDIAINEECPKCKSPKLISRVKDGDQFIACLNYPLCDYTLSDIRSLKSEKRCKKCGDYMVFKPKGNPPFFGCNSYSKSDIRCRYIEKATNSDLLEYGISLKQPQIEHDELNSFNERYSLFDLSNNNLSRSDSRAETGIKTHTKKNSASDRKNIKNTPSPNDKLEFVINDKVFHNKFGLGVVTSISLDKFSVRFNDNNEKKFMFQYASNFFQKVEE